MTAQTDEQPRSQLKAQGRKYRLLCMLLVTLLASACSVSPSRFEVDNQQQMALQRQQTWQATGKLGVRFKNDGQSANFDWHNRPDAFDLRLSGPFGQGTTWLRKDGRRVTLETADAPIRRARSAEHLMRAELGWQVPVSNLQYWIKGLPAPGQRVSYQQENPNGTLAELHQQGWQITYDRYRDYQGWVLPGKLIAKRDGIRLTMIVKNWQLPPNPQIAPAATAVP